ncbi:MAG: hypothetical protein JRI31_01770 [Deltaproteobacteria bacterium]|nr:hypothetical protein [Deltaproteobacteria bacterium]
MGVDKVGFRSLIDNLSSITSPDSDITVRKDFDGKVGSGDLDVPPPTTPPGGGGQPDIPPPTIDSGEMMIMLMELQSKISQERVRTGKADIEQRKQEMQKVHQERMEKLKEYWDKMSEAASKSTGFFGKLFSGLKKLFSGDIKGALEDFKEGFKANPFTAIMFTLAVVATVAVGVVAGPLAFVCAAALTAAIFAPQALTDPAVVKMIADATGSSVETVQKWCLGISITISVITAITIGVLSFGAGAAASAAIVAGAIAGIIEGGMTIESAVRSYQASKATEEGLKASAEADKLQASYEEIQETLKRNMEDVRELMESIANEMQKAMEFIISQGRMQMSMAEV